MTNLNIRPTLCWWDNGSRSSLHPSMLGMASNTTNTIWSTWMSLPLPGCIEVSKYHVVWDVWLNQRSLGGLFHIPEHFLGDWGLVYIPQQSLIIPAHMFIHELWELLSEMGRVLYIRVVPENGNIIVLVGDLLIQHVQTIQQVEVRTLQFGRGHYPAQSQTLRASDCNWRILPKFADLICRDQDEKNTGTDAEPLVGGSSVARYRTVSCSW